MENIDETFNLLAYGKCSACNKSAATAMHYCPYYNPMIAENRPDCNCCGECRKDCFFDGLSK